MVLVLAELQCYIKSDSRDAPEETGAGCLGDGVSDLHPQLHAGRDQRECKEPECTE